MVVVRLDAMDGITNAWMHSLEHGNDTCHLVPLTLLASANSITGHVYDQCRENQAARAA